MGLSRRGRESALRLDPSPLSEAPDYAASFGIALSTNRKNRVLRPPATNDTGDSEFSGSPDSFRKDRVLRVLATTDRGDSKFGAPTPLDLHLLSNIQSRGWIAQTLRSCRPSRSPDIQFVRFDDYHMSLPRIELGNINHG